MDGSVRRFFLASLSPAAGKSLIGLGLAVALRKRNVSLSCCITGANLSQAVHYRRLGGRYVHTLDERILTTLQILSTLQDASVGADVLMVEGHGRINGTGDGGRGSDASIARTVRAPVILVGDYKDPEFFSALESHCNAMNGYDVRGVIINRIAASEVANSYREQLEALCQKVRSRPVILGYVPPMESAPELSTSLVDYRTRRITFARQFFVDVGNIIEASIDLDKLLEVAAEAALVPLPTFEHRPMNRRCRIAVTHDSCFDLVYQDNLDLMRYFGAEVVTFSPLADSALPKKIGGVYLTGAFLQDYAEELAMNQSLHKSIRDFAASGGVIYSEMDGSAYLCQEFQSGDRLYRGVGVLPAQALYRHSPTNIYCDMVTVEDSILGPPGIMYKGITIPDWQPKAATRVLPGLLVTPAGRAGYKEGFSPGAQIINTFTFAHWGSNTQLARNLVDASEVVARI